MHNIEARRTLTVFLCALLAIGFVCLANLPFSHVIASGITQSAYRIIQNSGTPLTQRNTLNMSFSAGAGSCSDSGGITVCSITGSTTGSVTTGVTLTNGQLVLGAGSAAIKVGDLSGDVTTSGSTVTHMQHVINFVIDGGGSVIATGDTKTYPSVNYSCTINKAMISADQSGSITVDIWKANAAIPTSGNKISASAPVTLSASQLNQSSALTGWTTSVSANDVFGFSVATVATVTRVVGELWCQ